MIQSVDRLMFGAVTHGWPRTRIENYIEILKVDDPQSALPNVISRTFQLIDTKAGGLLTHTSMMIAALGVAGHLVADLVCLTIRLVDGTNQTVLYKGMSNERY